MTREDALKEAQRRWGNHADVFFDEFAPKENAYWVDSDGRDAFSLTGFGNTWEAAFADADNLLGMRKTWLNKARVRPIIC